MTEKSDLGQLPIKCSMFFFISISYFLIWSTASSLCHSSRQHSSPSPGIPPSLSHPPVLLHGAPPLNGQRNISCQILCHWLWVVPDIHSSSLLPFFVTELPFLVGHITVILQICSPHFSPWNPAGVTVWTPDFRMTAHCFTFWLNFLINNFFPFHQSLALRDVFPLAAGISNLAGGRGGRNLQRQKGGILSVIIYREPPPALLCNKNISSPPPLL